MRIKILRIIARLNIGGPARNAVLLSEGLCEKSEDYETVLVCGEVGVGEGDMTYLAKENGIEPFIVKELSRELSLRNDWMAFRKIYKVICKERPDIVHTHTAKAGTLGRLAGILYNVCNDKAILVHTFHGHVLCSYFGKVKTLFFIWVEKILALFTDRIVTVSESLKKELVERFKIAPEGKISVVELGFELDRLLKLPAREKNTIVNIGIVGRLVQVKNHRMLMRVAKELSLKNPETKIKIMIVGGGELRNELEEYVKELGIESIVEFKGWMRDLCGIYEELDIVALTSLNEGTPVSIIEAMAAGRPVAATRVGGVPDIVEDGKSGYLVSSDNDNLFMEKLLDLIKDIHKRKRFGEYGRNLARERFSKERLINDTKELYNKLLSERNTAKS